MPEALQPPLPGMPVRFIVSAVWESADRRCTIRATADTPSDEFSSTFVGSDTEGKMLLDELSEAMCVMIMATVDQYRATCT